jgi:hypothetical protein
MPEMVHHPGDIQPGDIFEDCRHHPCFCYDISDDHRAIFGISLVDGSTWQCSISHCGVRKLTPRKLGGGRARDQPTWNSSRASVGGERHGAHLPA